MGCLCSKESSPCPPNSGEYYEDKSLGSSLVHLLAPPSREQVSKSAIVRCGTGSSHGGDLHNGGSSITKKAQAQQQASFSSEEGGGTGCAGEGVIVVDANTIIVERPTGSSHHQRRATVDLSMTKSGGGHGSCNNKAIVSRTTTSCSLSRGLIRHGDGQAVERWPCWLTSVAAEAIKGWMPRRADSFAELQKIGQGTYSSVYKARDLETGKFVALKKVRFANTDPDSVRFMAREIHVLRKLDHPNVMKLEGLVTSKMSNTLYLIFEYMEHDLAGLAALPGMKFTEPQIKCLMQQLLRGLEHCHNHGVLHRDIKSSNLLINSDGVLKIGDFGLATFFGPERNQPLTSRVVTLWYRAPELLLGSTDYGAYVDVWSVGCILAELLTGKPVLPGRTEVEQMHKIFKLCGSPSEEYWRKRRLPHATSFKPHHPYKRCVADAFKEFPPSALNLVETLLDMEPERRGTATSALDSEFFRTNPLPCDPSDLPKYPPAKEFDIKLREQERRERSKVVTGQGPESIRRGINARESGIVTLATPESDANGEVSLQVCGRRQGSHKSSCPCNHKSSHGGAAAFSIDHSRNICFANGLPHCSTMAHPAATRQQGSSKWIDRNVGKDQEDGAGNYTSHGGACSSGHASGELTMLTRTSDDEASASTVCLRRRNMVHLSGPLMPLGVNVEDMLRDHERLIQHAVRKSMGRNYNRSRNNN